MKIPPTWAKESFTDYKADVEAWGVAHPGDDYTKYSEFLNELKRNKTRAGLSDYVSTVVVDRTRGNKTVKNILDEWEDKYELTKKEKFEDLINKIKNFKPNKADSGENIFGNIEKIQVEFRNLDIKSNLNYFLATLFVKEAFENGVMNDIEKRMVQDLIENKADENIMSEIKKEFNKMKIEGKREDGEISSASNESKTYYAVNDLRSWYGAWRNSQEF